jgi:heme A synthase
MTDDRKAGIALIAGSLGGILTMAIHPGQAWLPIDHTHLSILSGAAHSLAMLSVLLLFLGSYRLAQRLAATDRISFAAIVTYGFACIASMIAAAVSGFIMPNIMARMARDVPAAAHQWQILITGMFQVNQAFSRIFAVATSVAIVLWSVSALRNGGLGRGVATYGCIIGSLIILGIALGHLRLDVHGMAIVALGQVVWFILVGFRMLSANQPRTAE